MDPRIHHRHSPTVSRRNLRFLAPAVLMAVLGTVPVRAESLWYEPFASEAGLLPSGWDAAGDSSGDPASVEAGSLEFDKLKVSEGNRLAFAAKTADEAKVCLQGPLFEAQTTGSVFYSFLLTIEELGKMKAPGSHAGLVMLADRSAGRAVGGKAQAAVGVVPEDGGSFRLSISSSHAGPQGAATVVDQPLATGVTHFVVVGFDRDGTGGTARMWVNPVPGSPETEPSAIAERDAQAAKQIDCVFVGGQTSLMHIPAKFAVDEIRVGASWSEVTPAR